MEDGGGYRCKIDGASFPGTFSACSSGEAVTVQNDGTYTFSVQASDTLGNFGTPASRTWTVDTVTPAAPSVHLDTNSNSGSQNDNITKDSTPTIGGTAEAGSTIKIYNAQNNVVGNVTVGNDGTWSHTLSALQDGAYSYTARAADAAGNESQGSSISLTIDTMAPNTFLGDKPASPVNSGSATFTFFSSESGSTFVCSFLDPNIGWAPFASCTSPKTVPEQGSLADGTYSLQVMATDAAGNTDYWPASWNWTVDTIAPTINSVSPTNTATLVAPSINVAATFSESMNSSSISGQTFTLAQQGSTSPVAASVSYDDSTKKATLDPGSDLAPNTTYVATVKGASSGVKDRAGNTLAQDYSWTFTTKPPIEVTPSPLDFTPGTTACNRTITKTVTVTNSSASQVDLFPSVTNPHYSVASGVLHIAPGESLGLSVSWTAPNSGFRVRDPGRLEFKDAAGNTIAAGDLTAFINCGIEG